MTTLFKFTPVEVLADGFSPAYPARVPDAHEEKLAAAHAALFNAQRTGDATASRRAAMHLVRCQSARAAAINHAA